ncbi:MAG: peptidoglycan DD-metalloendopeptidase family protein [Patescibacteria group bacterium]|uniref:Peptidoglycan DD-metalloendopeptidase family protein n=1 Tax=candidate division WWE3 bacterium TaxID=2053526 RepID=A0A955ECJ3_UNCKA|nr:peptidoglycan DD-metalloendopeptidase family protein [candidate division WWE3 bacterium]
MNKSKFYTFLIVSAAFVTYSVVTVFAQEHSDHSHLSDLAKIGGEESTDDKVDDLEKEIQKYESKIKDLQSQAKTLSNEIAYADSQIALTELRIQNTIAEIVKKEKQIERLGGEIDNLEERIDKVSSSIDRQQVVLNERLRARYKSNEDSSFVFLFGSSTFNGLLQKTKYLKVMEEQDNKLLVQLAKTKDAFKLQKDLFEEKKDQAEDLVASIEQEKVNLESQRNALNDQKSSKARLLDLTQNDENKYQNLLAEAQKELNQISGAVEALRGTAPRRVKKGEFIGYQGNTGYSFGDHLHFGVYKYSSFDDITAGNWYYSNYVDPKSKLEEKNVYWDTGCESSGTRATGKGSWDWPMKDFDITQGFGHTCYSDAYYNGMVHPAYDMAGPYGSKIYAVEDGDAFFCRNCLGGGGNGVFIFHDKGYMTVYWHMQ